MPSPTDSFVEAIRVIHGVFKMSPVENSSPIRQAVEAFADIECGVEHEGADMQACTSRTALLKRVMGNG